MIVARDIKVPLVLYVPACKLLFGFLNWHILCGVTKMRSCILKFHAAILKYRYNSLFDVELTFGKLKIRPAS